MPELLTPPQTSAIVAPGNGRAMYPWATWFDNVYQVLKDVVASIVTLTTFLVEHNADGTHKFSTGTWTPTIGGTGGQSGQVYAQQNGYYVKAGPLVHVSCRVQLSTLGTITGAVQIKGLPFTSTVATGYRSTASVAWGNLNTAVVNVEGALSENATDVTLLQTAAATTSINTQFLAQGNLTNTTLFSVSLIYEANA